MMVDIFGFKLPWARRAEEKAEREEELRKWNEEVRRDAVVRMIEAQRLRDMRRTVPPKPPVARQAREDRRPTACELARDGEYLGLMQHAYGSKSPSALSDSFSGRGGSFDGGGASGDWSSSSSSSCDSGSSSSSSDSSSSSCSSSD